jgi:hypothetical protein
MNGADRVEKEIEVWGEREREREQGRECREKHFTSSVSKSDNLRLRRASDGSMAATFSMASALSTLGLTTSSP